MLVHTIFICIKWREELKVLNETLGEELNFVNVKNLMVKCYKKWKVIEQFIVDIIAKKEIDIRRE